LRIHIEKQFKEGMSWDNYGEWEIDHIVPLKYQNPTLEQLVERFHYTNLQPLWATENRSKSNKFIG
jgi:IS30 family transposase